MRIGRADFTATAYIALTGLILPFAANFIGGLFNGFPPEQYWVVSRYNPQINWGGIILIILSDCFAVGAASASRLILYRAGRVMRLIPTFLGYGLLALCHYNIDLGSDAQAGIALLFAPFFAALVIAAATSAVLFLNHLAVRRREKSGHAAE